MQSDRWAPTAKQKRFHDAVRALGCVVTGETVATELHHVKGASFKHDKVWIGQWWVICLRADLHNSGFNDFFNVTDFKHRFQGKYGDQRMLFLRTVYMVVGAAAFGEIKFDLNDLPPPEVIRAIRSCGPLNE